MTDDIRGKLTGCLLGMAVGDALGLPAEGLSRRRAARLFGGALRHHLVFGHGMISDDTEHAIMIAEALLVGNGSLPRFTTALAWRLRLWLLGVPAGVGKATAQAILKLWAGWPPAHSGVPSAGNGPAMRAPMLGAALAGHPVLAEFVQASTRMTHTDPRAEQGALLIALAAREGTLHGPVHNPAPVLAMMRQQANDPQLLSALEAIAAHLARQSSLQEFADDLGLPHGVSGFINHTVPVALYAWLRHPTDFRQAVEGVIALGGDTDTTGAITGGLLGAALGETAIPPEWIRGIAEWPRTIHWMRGLCERLAMGSPARPPACCWPALPLRNAAFLLIVLYHGFRRLLPPY